ncbi:hypothetical protein JHL17_32650 [Azospirillum sp. YIM B02556]|uniref:Uncharacterized protein n=1 Tax=Azospirillum endophyticum TaxID=2800326 RepID=A0ABS1FFF3_9PROT|nr:hypothetical protein [Azospirillum endophyticum]MBK1842156.1 hypothetical protein [Azospirillum endophyticum]
MSEYQYYEFQAMDRPLSAGDQAALRAISSRARITAASFTNHYEWGDLKASPTEMMGRWFDLQVYMAFWSIRSFMVRLPRRLFDIELIQPYAVDWTLRAEQKGDGIVLAFTADDLEIDGEDDGSGWMAALAPLRAQLLEGDLRCLYLGWLLAVQRGEVDEDDAEAPRPPGLSRLDGALRAFADYVQLDQDLLAAAAAGDEQPSDPLTDEVLGAFIRALPAAEKDELLTRLACGDGATVPAELRRRCRKALTGTSGPPRPARRVGDLLSAAEAHAEERRRIEAERAAAERVRRERAEAETRSRRLDALATRVESAWRKVEDLIEAKRAAEYEEAVSLLLDLRALAQRDGRNEDFRTRIARLSARHARKRTLIDRLDQTGLLR